jgi:hypothetical protein
MKAGSNFILCAGLSHGVDDKILHEFQTSLAIHSQNSLVTMLVTVTEYTRTLLASTAPAAHEDESEA